MQVLTYVCKPTSGVQHQKPETSQRRCLSHVRRRELAAALMRYRCRKHEAVRVVRVFVAVVFVDSWRVSLAFAFVIFRVKVIVRPPVVKAPVFAFVAPSHHQPPSNPALKWDVPAMKLPARPLALRYAPSSLSLGFIKVTQCVFALFPDLCPKRGA